MLFEFGKKPCSGCSPVEHDCPFDCCGGGGHGNVAGPDARRLDMGRKQ